MAAKAESKTMTAVMTVTSALVVAWPTAAEELPARIPCTQLLMAMAAPKKTPLKTPSDEFVRSTEVKV